MDRRHFLSTSGKGLITSGLMLTHWSHLDALETADAFAGDSFRHHELFDFDWKFHHGDIAHGEMQSLDDSRWQKLNLPHDWSIEGPFSETNPSGLGGAYLPGGIAWYRKEFVLPESYSGKHLEIEFDGIYMNSDVWLNGYHLGKRPYGYVSFNYDLTPYLRFGPYRNIIAVRVDNSEQPNSRWYSGSGIYRHVWLTAAELWHVDHWGTFVTTPGASSREAVVHISTRIKNSKSTIAKLRMVTAIHDSKETKASVHEMQFEIGSRDRTVNQEMRLHNPDLWSPDEPNLYTATSTLYRGDDVIDQCSTPFGVRWFQFDANEGFSLNGKALKLKGVCIHHDLGCLGAAFNDRAMERRLRLLKDMGCNAIRMSHNPPAPQLLDLCDEMGFLVIDEAFDEWRVGKRSIKYGYHLYFDEWAATDLKSMIERDRNHPSIILWSIGNEIPDKGLPTGVNTAKMLAQIVHETDPTRPVTCAVNNIEQANKSGFADVFDVVGYNGGGNSSFDYDKDHAKYPERRIYGSEAPHTAQTRGIYISDENYCSSYDDCFIRISSEGSWKLVEDRPFVAGEFRWAGIDYLGEPIPHPNFHIPSRQKNGWPARSGDFGVIDTCGFPKDIYYFYQSKWTDKPMLHILPHWNWSGMEGKPIFVWCYTNCDSVELLLNEVSLGAQHPIATDAYHLAWEVPYQPGVLKAIGKRNGEVICQEEVHTAGEPATILLSGPDAKLRADGSDVAHVTVRIADKDGNFMPLADNRVRFEVSGEGGLVGVDNGDPLSHDSLKGLEINAFSGMCLAVVQATRKPGRMTLRATSSGLASAEIAIESV